MLQDVVSRRLAFAIAWVFILWLAWVVGALVIGLLGPAPAAPRTGMERALGVYAAQIEAGSTDAKVWGSYIGALTLTGQYGQAQSALDAALNAITADRSYLLVEKAYLAQVRRRYEDAVAAAQEAMGAAEEEREIARAQLTMVGSAMDAALPPTYGRALLVKAESLVGLGDTAEAIEAYDEYLELFPTAANVFVARGDLRATAGDMEGAAEDYRAALRFVPDDAGARAGLDRIGEGD